jgi:hypothetical protein
VEICFSDHVSYLLAIASWKIIPGYKGGSQPGFGIRELLEEINQAEQVQVT